MHLYMYATPDTPPNAAAQNYIDIAEMYRSGFLNESSTVWMNANAPEVGMWTLTHRSTYLKVFRTVYPGWLRLTRTSAKWGRTAQATTKEPISVLDLRALPDSADDKATIVVAHRHPGHPVRVVSDGSIQHSNSNGVFVFDPFTVVDLGKYTAPEGAPAPSQYESAHAMISGAAIMATTSTEEGAEFIREHMDLYYTELRQTDLDFITKNMGSIEQYAKIRTDMLLKRIHDAGLTGKFAESESAF